MSASRFLKLIDVGGKKVAIAIETLCQARGYRVLVDAINPDLINRTTEKIEKAVSTENVLEPEHATKVGTIMITSLIRKTSENEHPHTSVIFLDRTGNAFAKGQITENPQYQQKATPL